MFDRRPEPAEYHPYYGRYIDAIADGQWRTRLAQQAADFRVLAGGTDDERAAQPLAEGKWSLHDVLNHVCDTERVFAFRLLWFARVPDASLPGFEQDDWALAARQSRRTVAGLLDEFADIRRTTLALIDALPEAAAARLGTAGGNLVTVRALAWFIPGHAEHHLRLLAAQLAAQ